MKNAVRLGIPSGLFPYGTPTNNLYAFPSSQFMLHAHLILLDLIILIILDEEYKLLRFINSECIKTLQRARNSYFAVKRLSSNKRHGNARSVQEIYRCVSLLPCGKLQKNLKQLLKLLHQLGLHKGHGLTYYTFFVEK
jgi:hypothetical protein